jgi:hypothetical protein
VRHRHAKRPARIAAPLKRLADSVIAWLMRPRVRRVRRWSFLVTVPVALVVGHVYGVHQGLLVIAVRAALWSLVAVVAWRLRDERGEALRDLLMHPRGRAFARAEFDILSALPRLIVTVAGRRRTAGMSYDRGTFGLALALAFTPVVVAEAAALHLLLRGGVVAWIATALHAYALLWLWGFFLGPRAYPHRVGARTAVLRAGPMYRVQLPLSAITSAVARTERVSGPNALTERDGGVLLAARGRVDVWLELAEPVKVQRPLHEPLAARRLAVASDDPDVLVAQLLGRRTARRTPGVEDGLGLLGGLDLVGLGRDVLQPG